MKTVIKNTILKQNNKKKHLRKFNKLQQDTVGKITYDKDEVCKYVKLKKKVKVVDFTKRWKTDTLIFQMRK